CETMRFVYLSLLIAATLAAAGDPYCPRYPDSLRTEIEQSIALDREADAYSRLVRRTGAPNMHAAQRLAETGSFIDALVAKKMNLDGVAPAPASSDAEFLRRVSLDLTGRIPAVDKAAAFLDDASPSKHA